MFAYALAVALLIFGNDSSAFESRQARPPAQTSASPDKPDQSLLLNVAATEPWTDTGLTVYPGDRLSVRAWGSVRAGDLDRPVPPAGRSAKGGGCSYVVTDSRIPQGALVANIAPRMTFDGNGFLVGSQWSGPVPVAGTTAPQGRLFLGFNDDAMLCDRSGYDSWEFRINNSGAFTVEVSIRRRK